MIASAMEGRVTNSSAVPKFEKCAKSAKLGTAAVRVKTPLIPTLIPVNAEPRHRR
jgi:hypothetical protein